VNRFSVASFPPTIDTATTSAINTSISADATRSSARFSLDGEGYAVGAREAAAYKNLTSCSSLLRDLLGGALEEFVDESLIGLGLLGGEAGERTKSRSLSPFGMTPAEVASDYVGPKGPTHKAGGTEGEARSFPSRAPDRVGTGSAKALRL
jgi:hypothetical protein